VFAGVYTTIEKLSFAVGPAVLGLLLGWAGYVGGADAAQSETSRQVIAAGVSILPGLGITLAALIMTRYRLDAHQLESPPERDTSAVDAHKTDGVHPPR
jgi:GPH family glycoside/pentoside/hexuronide:cation symporter